ncbi:MAG: helix-turn-helix domain-containing protein [Gemmatimonadetes bacterium]|nr:helix-turn-helix domain-containing protein [Gemmatimonadota bacterium]
MDGPRGFWYFSTMPERPARPLRYAFLRTKYGRELLVDAAWVRELAGFDTSTRAHVLDFFDVLLVTRGRGTFALDDRVVPVSTGTLLFTRPGEVRQWHVRGLDGACLFFTGDFLAGAFSDARFPEQFACFDPGRPSQAVQLTSAEQRRYRALFAELKREIGAAPADESLALRALVYQLLVQLQRWYVRRHGAPRVGAPGVVERFRSLVDERFMREHRVGAYARALGVSPGHLTVLCQSALGQGAGAVVRDRLALEARRLLRYTELSVQAIGAQLGFDDPAYFARFVRRETGQSPGAIRRSGRRNRAP